MSPRLPPLRGRPADPLPPPDRGGLGSSSTYSRLIAAPMNALIGSGSVPRIRHWAHPYVLTPKTLPIDQSNDILLCLTYTPRGRS